MTLRKRAMLAGLLGSVLVVATACGAGGESAEGEAEQVSSAGVSIVTGEWPFNTQERCEDESAPACDLSDDPKVRDWSALAGAGSVFTSDIDITVTYRGGLVHRASTADAVNDESVHVLAFLDVTFPDEAPNDDSLLSFDPTRDLTLQVTETGTADVEVWPSDAGQVFRPEPGETITLVVSAASMGPRALLGEDDPLVYVNSGYTYNLGPDLRTSGSALFSILDQDPDAEVLDDVRASIELFAARSASDSTDGGLSEFQRVLARWLDGAPLVSSDDVTAGEAPADMDGDLDQGLEPEPDSAETIDPPEFEGEDISSSTTVTFSDGATDGLEAGRAAGADDALNGKPLNDAFSDRVGEYYAHPDSDDYREGFDLAFSQGYREAYEEVKAAQGGSSDTSGSGDGDSAGDECADAESLMECYG